MDKKLEFHKCYEMSDGSVIYVHQLSGDILDTGAASFFICRTCYKRFIFYSDMCHDEAVQPVTMRRAPNTFPYPIREVLERDLLT